MKRLHIIHAKSLDEVRLESKDKLFPILEKETIEWAKQFNPSAYTSTVAIKEQAEKDPYARPKYFKYLRRLLELKLEAIENELEKSGQERSSLDKHLIESLLIESVRLPVSLSCTQLGMYIKCKRNWFLRYALGIKVPTSGPLFFGSAVDHALNFYFEQKIAGKAPPTSAVHAAFFEKFENQTDPIIWGNDKPENLRNAGPIVLDAYIKEFGERTKPVDIQTEICVQLANGGLLGGFIDILEKDAVIDTKTAKEKWNTEGPFAKHKKELQPKAYSLWYLEQYEKVPQFRYQIVTKETDANGKLRPQTQLISFEVKKFELEGFRREVQKIWDEIMEGLKIGKKAFPPEAEKEKPIALCCHEYCEYSKICEADGLKIALRWDKKQKRHIYADEGKNGK